MYLADYHTHCAWSMDAKVPMARMALAAADKGFDEICFTDHVEPFESGSWEHNVYDFAALDREYEEARAAVGDRILIRRGVELGEAPRDFQWCEEALRQLGELDFVIGSIHQLSEEFGCQDLLYASTADPELSKRQIRDYLEVVLKQAHWGNFCVQGHLTLPLRYLNELRGFQLTFDDFGAEIGEILRLVIQSGRGIELNTNHGHQFLPDEKWLRLYRSLGGEIITLGSDAHRPCDVGRAIREGQELLRQCGFRRFCTFEKMEPVWHEL